MKKSTIRAFGVLVSLFVVTSTFAGCKAKVKEEAVATKKGPTVIKMMNRINAEVKIEDNQYFKEIEKVANVKLEIEAPPINNYNDRLQIVMASGDLPDLIYIWNLDSNFERWAQEGLLISLDDKVQKYSNLQSNLSKEMWESTRTIETGKIHGVPKANRVNHWGYIATEPWLQNLGIKPPKTIDEFYEAAKVIAKNDPDKNGKADTFAISPVNLFSDRYLLGAFNLNETKGRTDYDGNYKIKEKFDGYMEYLNFMRKLYAEKLIDPEFFMNKVYNDIDKQLQNRIGFTSGHEGEVVVRVSKEADSLKKFKLYPPLQDKKGQVNNFNAPPVWGAWAISNKAKDVDGILKFLDWGNSQEGFLLMNLGIKGVHYNDYIPEKRMIVKTKEQSDKTKSDLSSYTSISYAMQGKEAVPANSDTTEKLDVLNAHLENYLKNTKDINVPPVKSAKLDLFGAENPDLSKKKTEQEVLFVTGNISEADFKKFLNNEYFAKIDVAEKEYIELMKKKK